MKYLYITLILTASVLTGCNLGRGFKGLENTNENWTNREGVSQKEVDRVMFDCGYTELTHGYGKENTDNDRALRQECMFSRGYFRKNGWGGLCSISDRRPELPACKDAPIRPRNGYYGN